MGIRKLVMMQVQAATLVVGSLAAHTAYGADCDSAALSSLDSPAKHAAFWANDLDAVPGRCDNFITIRERYGDRDGFLRHLEENGGVEFWERYWALLVISQQRESTVKNLKNLQELAKTQDRFLPAVEQVQFFIESGDRYYLWEGNGVALAFSYDNRLTQEKRDLYRKRFWDKARELSDRYNLGAPPADLVEQMGLLLSDYAKKHQSRWISAVQSPGVGLKQPEGPVSDNPQNPQPADVASEPPPTPDGRGLDVGER